MYTSTIIPKLALALITLASLANADAYAQFCDDNACSVNCGESVDTTNPGCLAESGRNSIAFHGENYFALASVSLVLSPADDCNCQNDCVDDILLSNQVGFYGPSCYDLNGHAFAESFRFIGGNCGGNNC